MPVLEIIQAVTSRVGIPVPAAVFSATSQDVIQLRELLRQSARSLNDDYDWMRLRKERQITTLAQEVQTGAKPSDFGWIQNGTFFDRTRAQEVIGPLSPRQYQGAKASLSTTAIDQYFIFRGDDILLWPAPPAGNTMAFEYQSLNWARSSVGAEQPTFLADTDSAVWSDDLLGLSLEWRWLKAKGLDYAEAFSEFEDQLNLEKARDGGAPRISFSWGMSGRFRGAIGFPSLPDGSWPLT